MTGSWVFILAKFTPEALLLEVTVILFLLSGYCVFWVLRKRKYGALREVVPTGLVKAYLNELIFDAEQMRAYLFGLLHGEGTPAMALPFGHGAGLVAVPSAASAGNADPALLAQIAALEAKMSEKDKAVQALLQDKEKIVKELELSKDAAQKGGAGGEAGGDNSDLLEKIKALEARLSEYSVIEDDLANLKRLQQENAQLKSQLKDKGMDVSGGAKKAAPATAEVAAAATPAAELDGGSAADPQAIADAALDQAAAVEDPIAAAEIDVAKAKPDAAFESLVDEVEKSLDPVPAESMDLASAADSDKDAAKKAGEAPKGSQSDDDLVAEFEKMLNS